jgi:muconolactone D-isomerase
MEFLVQMTVSLDGESAETDALRASEARRAGELAEAGILVRLWRIPGRTANWGLWRVVDATELHSMLMSLPLAPYSTFDVRTLARHPNDPGTPQV